MTRMNDKDIAINNPLSLALIQSESAFKALKDDWEELVLSTKSRNICQQFDWCALWWDTYKSPSKRLYVLTIYAKDKLVGIVPFFISSDKRVLTLANSTLRLIGQDSSTNRAAYVEGTDILVAKGYEQLLISKVTDFLQQKDFHWNRFIFRGLSDTSLLTKVTQGLKSTMQQSTLPKGEQLLVSIPNGSYDDFLAEQSQDWRSTFRGYLRLLKSSGEYDIQCADTNEKLMPALHSMVQIHCSQQRKQDSGNCHFDSALYMQFYEKMCEAFSSKKQVVIMSLLLEGRLLASSCLFVADDVLYCNQLSSVRGEGIRFSPQLILMMWAIRSAAEKGLSKVVFQSDINLSKTLKNISNAEYKKTYVIEGYTTKRKAFFVAAARKFTRMLGGQQASSLVTGKTLLR